MRKTFLLVPVILLLAAACSSNRPVSQQEQKDNGTSQQQTQPTDETANWKTYTNSKFGLEFKYPPQATLQEYDLSNQKPVGDAPYCPQKPGLPGCLDLTLKFSDGTEMDYIYQTREMGKDLDTIVKTEKITVDNKNYDLLIDNRGNASTHIGQEVTILFYNDNQRPDLDLFRKILSTFKFTTSDATVSKVKIYYINTNVPNHNGPVGCGDEAVGLERQITPTTAPLKAALEILISSGQPAEETGLYSAVAKQNWKLESVSIINGEAVIKFSGKYIGIGTCEDPRIKAQIEKTALQFPTVNKVSIFVGGTSLDKLMSGKGE